MALPAGNGVTYLAVRAYQPGAIARVWRALGSEIPRALVMGQMIKCNFIADSIDRTPPRISLLGNETIYLIEDEVFVEPGYSASDEIDGDLTEFVRVTINGDTTANNFSLDYTVRDQANNLASLRRMVFRYATKKNQCIV